MSMALMQFGVPVVFLMWCANTVHSDATHPMVNPCGTWGPCGQPWASMRVLASQHKWSNTCWVAMIRCALCGACVCVHGVMLVLCVCVHGVMLVCVCVCARCKMHLYVCGVSNSQRTTAYAHVYCFLCTHTIIPPPFCTPQIGCQNSGGFYEDFRDIGGQKRYPVEMMAGGRGDPHNLSAQRAWYAAAGGGFALVLCLLCGHSVFGVCMEHMRRVYVVVCDPCTRLVYVSYNYILQYTTPPLAHTPPCTPPPTH